MAVTLSPSQELFSERLARDTGLDLDVVRAWARNEQGVEAERTLQGKPYFNWLNIGVTDWNAVAAGGGPSAAHDPNWFKDPVTAADLTALYLQGKYHPWNFGHPFSGILQAAAMHDPQAEIRAIQQSGWASGGESGLQSLYQSEKQGNVPASFDVLVQGAKGYQAPGGGGFSIFHPIRDLQLGAQGAVSGVESGVESGVQSAASYIGMTLLRLAMIGFGAALVLFGLYFVVKAMGAPVPDVKTAARAYQKARTDPLEAAFASGEQQALRSEARRQGRTQTRARIERERPSSQNAVPVGRLFEAA